MRYDKLSAGLASVVEQFQTQGAAALLTRRRAVPLGMLPSGEPILRLFMRCLDQARFDHLPDVRVHGRQGRIRTADVPVGAIGRLTDDESVIRLAPARRMRPLLDVAGASVGTANYKAANGRSGAGVIVGVVDTGIDSAHPAFAGRVLSIWDQLIAGPGWGTTNYGTILSGATLGVSSDTNGHGTHVAGIAAGADAAFEGVAHQADLIIVKTDFQNTSIADGIRYVFAEAERLDRPAVVNLSLGGHWDAHDGSDDLSTLIDQESGQGRIVVVSAGNEGTDPIHAEFGLDPGAIIDVPFRVVPNSSGDSPQWVAFNGWYDGTGRCEVRLENSSGAVTPWQSVITAGSPTRTHGLPNAQIGITTPPATSNPNGDHQFVIDVTPLLKPVVQGGLWRIWMRNTGVTDVRIDIWSAVNDEAAPAAFQAPALQAAGKVGSPGASASALTVGAYTTRNAWTDMSGSSWTVGMTLHDMAEFSSSGPLRNGAEKPDLAAPGAMIASCRSSAAVVDPAFLLAAGIRLESGTSMASPYVAGLVALLLEADRWLDPAGARTLLRAASAIPGGPVGGYHPHWGYGLIDATLLP